MSQTAAILQHLQQGNTLTVLSALQLFGCMALSQRVSELKREGEPIKSEMVAVESGKRVARYSWDFDAERVAY